MKKTGKTLVLSAALLFGAAFAPESVLNIGQAETVNPVQFPKTTYQTTAVLDLRSGAGTNFKSILKIPAGKTVLSAERMGNWYKVSYVYTNSGKNQTATGWVNGGLKEYYQYTNMKGTYYITNKQSSLYPTPDTKQKEVYRIAADNGLYSTQKVVNSIGQTWYRVSFNGKNVFIEGTNVNQSVLKTFKSTTYKALKDTYVYQSHGNAYKKLVKIPTGTLVLSDRNIGNWYKVTYGGKTGYFYKSDFSVYTPPVEVKIPVATTFLVSADLNVRKIADWSAASLVVLPKGKIIIPTHKLSNGWYKVTYSGKTGYVPGDYVQEVKTGDPLTSRTGYQFVDLRKPANVTAKQIDDYIASYVKLTKKTSVLTEKGQAFIDAGNKYGVNAVYLAAHAIHESAFGTSLISQGKMNLFGFGAYDASPYVAAVRFASVDQNIEYIAREMKTTYLNPENWKYKGAYLGFSTKNLKNARVNENSEGMNYYYASDPLWGKKIADHMAKIIGFNSSHYAAVIANTIIPEAPSRPAESDIFPNHIQAVAKKDLVIYEEKDGEPLVDPIKKGTIFLLLEKQNDFWVKISVDENIYWTKDIKFDVYNQFMLVANLGRTTGNPLNVRTEPTASAEKIGNGLALNTYVQLVLKEDGTPYMDSTKKWYQIKLDDDTTGWVSASYVVRELK
ncbi:SH3 domain-containing protein [Bacillus sp. V5-8f]|uniref:SH3 domain-containing protein n=1 Tax=Bacillus sp. V5-8f TaxID=2053044 RepID=UPI000C76DCCE|nr:SH3 domain-containing protein [Bacillus sp. V5-8f]PLT35775.1 peptide-binding protein [Bacillus sp. V5-8f]